MNKKTGMIAVGVLVTALIIWVVIENNRERNLDKQPAVIQAVSEIEKNLKESDQKAK